MRYIHGIIWLKQQRLLVVGEYGTHFFKVAIVRKLNIQAVLLPVCNMDTFLKKDILLKYKRLPANKADNHVVVV